MLSAVDRFAVYREKPHLPAGLRCAKLLVMLKPLAKLVALLMPKRTWFQFRLRTLFVLVLVAAVPCGWLKWKMVRKERERRAVAEISLNETGVTRAGVAELQRLQNLPMTGLGPSYWML